MGMDNLVRTSYYYAMELRPLQLGAQPKGHSGTGLEFGRHGWIRYDRELTLDEVKSFELRPITEVGDKHSKEILDWLESKEPWYHTYQYLINNNADAELLSQCDDIGGTYAQAAQIYRQRHQG